MGESGNEETESEDMNNRSSSDERTIIFKGISRKKCVDAFLVLSLAVALGLLLVASISAQPEPMADISALESISPDAGFNQG